MRYHLGEPIRLGGQWAYPREDFALDERGVVAIWPTRAGRTANGEAVDPRGLLAAHRTLQLPAIVSVTNLENGRSLRLRVNERGPDTPGRVLAVTPRAAELLGARSPFQARVAPGAASLPRAEAPRPAAAAAGPLTPARLPEQVQQGTPQAGRLVIEGPSFFRADFARAQAVRLGFRAEPFGPPGRQQQWRTLGGPYPTLGEADAAFARALATGQQDLRLVVE
jgi:rare lipoprotein A